MAAPCEKPITPSKGFSCVERKSEMYWTELSYSARSASWRTVRSCKLRPIRYVSSRRDCEWAEYRTRAAWIDSLGGTACVLKRFPQYTRCAS